MKEKQVKKKEAYRFKRFTRKAYSAFNSMHRVVNIGVVGCCVLTFSHATETSAQTLSTVCSALDDEQQLEEVTVTASQIGLTQEQAAGLVTIISHDEIERTPVQSIEDLLDYLATIDVQQRGPHGVQADIFVRGGSFDQTAILLNGMNLSNPQTGHYSFDIPLHLSDIERIEIIHGPSSFVYGAHAFSGGINIITRKHTQQKASVSAGAGSYGLWNASVSGSIPIREISNLIAANYASSDGYTDNSDYKIGNTLLQSNWKSGNSKADVQLGYNNKKYGANTFYSAAYPNQYDETSSIVAGFRGETGTTLKIMPAIYWNRHYDCFQLIRGNSNKVPYNYHRSDVYDMSVNLQYTWKTGITSAGINMRNENILSSVLGKPLEKPEGNYTNSDSRTDINYLFEHYFQYVRFNASAGVQINHNSANAIQPFHCYPVIYLSYRMNHQWKIYTSWKNASRMPTFTDLYYNTATHTGNPDLLPEKSQSIELGIHWSPTYLNAFISGYWMQGKDLIDWKMGTDEKYHSQNTGIVNKKGIETGTEIYFHRLFSQLRNNLTLKLGYAYLYQQPDEQREMVSLYVFNYLKHKVTAQLHHPVCWGISADWFFRWQDREGMYLKYEDRKPANKMPYPAYSLIDLKISKDFKSFRFYFNVNNLLNTTYYDLGNIPQPGIWLSGGIAYHL